MANTHETLTGLFTDIAGAIRSKTGETGTIVADQFPDAIAAIDTQENLDAELSTQDSLIAQINTALVGKAGVALPVLSNPAGAENIEAGYQAISGSGEVMEGLLKAVKPERVAISNSTSFNHTSRCAVNITSNPSSIGYEAQAGDVLIRADFQMVGYVYQYGDYLYAYFMHTVTATSTPSGEYYLLRGVI